MPRNAPVTPEPIGHPLGGPEPYAHRLDQFTRRSVTPEVATSLSITRRSVAFE
jgi:hypothetical protein